MDNSDRDFSFMKKEITIVELKGLVRKTIIEKYGSVAKFLSSEQGKKIGGKKIRTYLYDTGSVNVDVLNRICTRLGIGNVSKETKVVREVKYFLDDEE